MRTLCPYCGVGCGLVASVEGDRLVEVAGDPLYPVNRGRTCRKPLELPAAVHARDRAVTPLVRGRRDVGFRSADWDTAIAGAASRLRRIIERDGPDAVAFYISGQLLTEDYYVVNKLAKGFLGTNNVDSNSRLCMSSAVAGYQGAFGSDGPPPAYADLELADCLFLLGSNAAACHPIVWSRIRERQREGAYVICADPRLTQTAQGADLHLAVRPGTDLALLNAMLHVIVRDGLVDDAFVRARTIGFEEAAAVAAEWTPERAAATCGVPAADIEVAARRFASAGRAMALWSMGANQSTVGTLKNRALINLCLAAGQIGRPGTGPLSLTGQPNAMGGREVGGLAHLLPGYRHVENPADRAEMQKHWRGGELSARPGLPAVELFDALADGRVKAVWIAGTNPMVSFPNAARLRAALERAELVVVQDAHHPTETSALADVVLAAAVWPEKTGTMTNSERRVGLVRAALRPPGEARPDWRIFAALAGALGFKGAFAWKDEAAVFDEFVACTAGRVCDMTGLSHERLAREGGVQWPCPAGLEEHPGTPRLYADRAFATDDGRARFAATPHAPPAESGEGSRSGADFPTTLTTGRVGDHWHTLTRTGKSRRLIESAGEPMLELGAEDARAAGVADGELARVRSARGSAVLRVQIDAGIPSGVAFAPMHWGALHAPPGAGSVNLVTHGAVDPVSRQPELKASAVKVEPVKAPGNHPRGPAARRAPRQRLVVVGAGMAGQAVAEEVLARRPGGSWSITMLGEEPGVAYNRILLSKLLARTCGPAELELRPPAWYAAHGVMLRSALPAAALDINAGAVIDAGGSRHPYDALVLATGSRPFVPPLDGGDQAHVYAFRTRSDACEIAAAALAGRPALVIGGGLLGLEAAAGLLSRGMWPTVVERAPSLMPQQLDRGASAVLAARLQALGIEMRLARSVSAIGRDVVQLDDGEELPAGLVVMAAGVRPEVSLAREAGIEVGRAVVVDDAMRTSAPGVFAAGECAEHRGVVSGLWAPVAEQARVAAAGAVGDPAAFLGTVPSTTLKVAGVDVFAGGASHGPEEVVFSDTRHAVYRKLVLDGDRLAGAVLVGDTRGARTLSERLRSGEPIDESLVFAGETPAANPGDARAVICSCNSVTRGQIDAAIRTGGLSTPVQVGRVTRAGTGCGSCTTEIESILAEHDSGSSDRNTSGTAGKPPARIIAA
ncbi:MAG: molybdopterin-dependent oxidoreductase [Solirubrobacteraceae bacterium]